ncbi:MAG: type II secretion system F family protein [Candidatus Micrarchaeota archaeon]|nr:type II secretion system F family protein [Candidatus Micrarchaeota archaeon]
MDILYVLGRHLPEKVQKEWELKARAAGINVEGATLLGLLIIWAIISFIVAVFLSYTDLLGVFKALNVTNFWARMFTGTVVYFAVLFFSGYAILVGWLEYLAEKRKQMVEKYLPDFLILISSNLRSGMPLDQAIWNAAKPEFGVLAEATKLRIKEAFGGKPIEEALEQLAEDFNTSLLFTRTIRMITEAIKTGAELSTVLERTADEIREIQQYKEEMKTNILVYKMFIFFATALGMPFLYAVSMKIIEVLYSALSQVEGITLPAQILGGGLTFALPRISPESFFYFALLSIFITAFFSARIIAAGESSKTAYFRYLIGLWIVAFAVFFISQALLDILFKQLL